jgi:hypothetical protein
LTVCVDLFHDVQQLSRRCLHGADGSVWTLARLRAGVGFAFCGRELGVYRCWYLHLEEMSRKKSAQNDFHREYRYVDHLYLLHRTTIDLASGFRYADLDVL